MKADDKYKLHPSVFYRDTDEKIAVYFTAKSMLYTFNKTAKIIFDFFQQWNTFDDLFCYLKTDFQTKHETDEFINTINGFLESLMDEGILIKNTENKDYPGYLENEISDEFANEKQLYSATIELTYRCNERCRHCYVYDDGGKELSTEQVKRVLDELCEIGVLTVLFTGGEVFARSDIFEILEYAYQKKLAIDIFTNGTLLDGDKIIRLKSIWPKCIHFSVYSHIPEKHDAVTQIKGSFDKTIQSLKACKLVGLPVKIKMPVFSETANDISGVIQLAKDLGASVGISSDITPKKNGNTDPLQMRIINNDADGSVAEKIDNLLGDLYKPNKQKNMTDRICSAGARMISINPYGKVYPCVSFPLCIGDINTDSVVDIWNNSEQLNKWRHLNKVSNRSECVECAHLNYCRFCPGEALMYNGNPTAKYEDACFVTESKRHSTS